MAGLYLHIPFCVQKCAYCDFLSFREDGGLEAYVDALCGEIRLAGQNENLPHQFRTLFMGGGTPSLLSPSQIERIMDAVRGSFALHRDGECSFECNPGAAPGETLRGFFHAGFNRVSIGCQSTDDALLKSIGRIHTFSQFLSTVALARDAGFENINADLMHGLPGQTTDAYLRSIRDVADLGVRHISAYALILEEHTPLYASVGRKEILLPDPDEVADMEDAGMEYLCRRGYRRYEISNFAQPGWECRHNLGYWDNDEYLGLGLGAHSAFRGKYWTRQANTESLGRYYSDIRKGKLPLGETIRLYPADEMFETIMLGLRKIQGLGREAFLSRFGVSIEQAYPKAVEALRQKNWLNESDGWFALNDRGLDMQNRALQYFM